MAAAAAQEKSLSLWLAKKKFDLSRDFPHLCHATAPPLPHRPLTARCSVLIWLASGKLLYQLRLCFFHFFFYRISFTLPCGKVCRVTWRRHSCVLQQHKEQEQQEQERQPAAVSSARIETLGASCYWLTTNHFSSLSFSLILAVEIELKFTFLIICVACDTALICLPLPFPPSWHLFRCVSDSFARCQLIRCAFAFN